MYSLFRFLIKNTIGQELQNESDRRCEKGTRCVSTEDCPEFLKNKKLLEGFDRGSRQYKEIRDKLRESVCNKKLRAVCCKIEAEEKCDDGKSCIPADQCRYDEVLYIKYKNGDNAAKDELVGLVCNIKERKGCCHKDQETGEILYTFQRQ